MRFTAFDEQGQPLLIAFALPEFEKGNLLSFETFSYRESVRPGTYTLTCGEKSVTVVLPDEAANQPLPGHLIGHACKKAS